MILSIVLFLAAVICYSIRDLQSFGKLKWSKEDASFWGDHSSDRKYADPFEPPLENWYYRFFKIGYKEAFPGSATIFVMFTDSSHLMQFFYKLLFCAAFYPLTNWWFAVTLWVLWGITFSLCDKYLTK